MDYVLSGKAVRRLIPVVRGVSGGTGTTYPQAAVSPDAFPPPYTVRWSAAANSKDGAWVIWLGDRSRVLYHNGVSRQPAGVVPESALPAGWFRVRAVSASSTAVWLNVRTDSSTGAFGDAILSQAPGSATTGYDVASYCVATMAHDSTTGRRAVKQHIDSAVTLGAGASGSGTLVPDNVSTELIPPPPQGEDPDGDEGRLQVKGWKAGAPTSQTTLAQDLQATGSQGHLVLRNASGALEYKPIGQLPTPPSPPTGTVEFVADCDWYVNGSVHQLRKRLRILDLVTGQVTDKPGTTYAGGWEVMANTTPISGIIN